MGKQKDLVKIGLEGFAIFDKFYYLGKNKKPTPPPPPRHQELQNQHPRPFFEADGSSH